MGTSSRTTGVRIACAAAALVLAAMIGGCAGTASTQSSGTNEAVAPGAPVASDGAAARGGIGGQSSTPYAEAPSASAPATAKGALTGAGTTVGAEKLIVVNKTIRLETADVQGSLTKIRDLVAKANGDISSMQVSTSVDEPVYATPTDASQSSGAPDSSSVPLRAFVIVRVPSTGYATFIAEAAKLGRVLYQSESADDVTQQHVDMQARLGNLTAEQSRLRQLFARAKNVDDMLAIEQELTRVQGDIESLKAQIAYLERQAAMATVTLELTEPLAIGSPAGIDWGIGTALTDAIRAFVNTMNGLIVLLGPVLAILVFVGLPVWLIVWLVRRATHRRRVAKAPMPAAPAATDTPGDGSHT
ncbi:MAG TPA: DUF4349 domain-containing protein [Coriobacteriia bacterium]